MYLVIFEWKTKGTDTKEVTWEESFPTLISAVRFGMWKYRIWEEVISFKVSKIPKRNKYTLKYW